MAAGTVPVLFSPPPVPHPASRAAPASSAAARCCARMAFSVPEVRRAGGRTLAHGPGSTDLIREEVPYAYLVLIRQC